MKAGARSRPSRSLIPLWDTLRTYQASWLRGDVVAGLTACMVMIPSVMAYAELVHLPAITGLYAALAAAVGYALFASSRQVIAGPDAAIGLLVGTAILPLAAGDPLRLATLAAVLALMAGAVLLLAARLQLGVIADLLSRPVLVGYLNGASLILLSTQLGKVFSIPATSDAFFPVLGGLIRHIGQTHVPTMILGITLMIMLFGLARWFPKIPGALVVAASAMAGSYFFEWEQYGIALVGAVPSGIPSITMPEIYWADIAALAPAAFAIAFLAFSDGILLAQSFAEKNNYEVNPNQELAALGSANILAAVWQGFFNSCDQRCVFSRVGWLNQAHRANPCAHDDPRHYPDGHVGWSGTLVSQNSRRTGSCSVGNGWVLFF
jgi:SulP family sulfate permease